MTRLFLMLHALRRSLSGMGLLLGTLFFAAALTPSLAPRSVVMQGVLCGVAFSCGYGAGYLLRRLWCYLELPEPGAVLRRRALLLIGLLCAAAAVAALILSVGWQNSIHAVMRMPPLDSAYLSVSRRWPCSVFWCFCSWRGARSGWAIVSWRACVATCRARWVRCWA